MNKHRSYATSRKRLAGSQCLGFVLAMILALQPAAFPTSWGNVAARNFDAHTLAAPLAPTLIAVNTTGDGDNVDANTGCDADAATAGEQCTLRAAIQRANVLAGDDEITFSISTSEPNCDASTGACIIKLTKALPDLNTNVAINGPGMDKLEVRRDTGGEYRIFNVTGGSTVTFHGLTISNGRIVGSGMFGGGIQNVNGTVNITDSTIRDNFANQGGGISNAGGTMNVTNSTISNNTSSAGGGINNSGTLIINDSMISDNSCTQGGGGLLNLSAGTMNINNSTISNNSSGGGAGGLFNFRNGVVSISNSTISRNNTGSAGGGIAAGESSAGETTTTTLTNCTLSDNAAAFDGGGIYISSGSTFSVANSTVSRNFTGTRGGGIASTSSTGGSLTANITNSTVYDNTAIGGDGGGILIGRDSTFNVTNSTISGNIASKGGGITIAGPNGVGRLKSNIIAINTALGFSPDVNGTFTSEGFNLIGQADGSIGSFIHPADQPGSSLFPIDPKLDPAGLQDNGGPTQTIALLAGSKAIDTGSANGLTGALSTDQRGTGFTRTFDDPSIFYSLSDGTDVGAFERTAATSTPTPTPTATPSPTPTATPTPTPTATPTPTPTPIVPTFEFDQTSYAIDEGVTSVNVRVLRSGPAAVSAAVDIVSEDGTAKQTGDYTLVVGHLSFAAGEIEKSFQVLINDDSYAEGFEFATLILQHPENGTLGAKSTAMLQIIDDINETATNPIDHARTFVGTHYHDFLYRDSDKPGEDFWTEQIEQCGGDAACRQQKRVDVSTAFFISIEFQQTGFFVIRAHKAAFGNLKSNPQYATLLRDQRQIADGVIVGQANWQQELETNKQRYLEDFVSRPEFVSIFPHGQPAVAYVDQLFANVGVAPTVTARDAAVAAYSSGNAAGRAAALSSVIESATVFNALYNPAFVLMQYYGYLRRNPDDLPDNNFNGYDFWLAKMNSFTLPDEDARNEAVAVARVRRAEMVKAFIESSEYRNRFFGAAGGNQQGAIKTDH